MTNARDHDRPQTLLERAFAAFDDEAKHHDDEPRQAPLDLIVATIRHDRDANH